MKLSAEGATYLFLACDQDCTDVGLTVWGADGFELRMTWQDEMVMRVVVPIDGRYEVEVQMFSCNLEPCSYGLLILGPTPAA